MAPIQALHTLANAADQAASRSRRPVDDTSSQPSDGEGRGRKRKRRGEDAIHLRVKKQTKPDPTPRNPFPDVVTKGLVSDVEARELWDM